MVKELLEVQDVAGAANPIVHIVYHEVELDYEMFFARQYTRPS